MPIVDHNSISDAEVFEGVFSRQLLNKKVGGAAAITVGELKLKPGSVLPTHVHYVEEALTVVAGQGEVVIGGESFAIHRNMTILVPSGKEMIKIFYCFPAVEVERVLM